MGKLIKPKHFYVGLGKHAVVYKRDLGGLSGWVLIALEELTAWKGLDPLGGQLSRS